MSAIAVAIVEDEDTTRDCLAELVSSAPGVRLVGAFRSIEAAAARLRGSDVQVALVDIGLPGMSGIQGVARLRQEHPALHVLMLTIYADNEKVFDAICAGACGYLLKDTPPDRLLQAIREAHDGGAPMSPEVARKVVTMFQRFAPPPRAEYKLTPRELQILKLLAEGHGYKTAAAALDLGVDTVRFHIRHIYEKLHVHSKSEAVARALRDRIL